MQNTTYQKPTQEKKKATENINSHTTILKIAFPIQNFPGKKTPDAVISLGILSDIQGRNTTSCSQMFQKVEEDRSLVALSH